MALGCGQHFVVNETLGNYFSRAKIIEHKGEGGLLQVGCCIVRVRALAAIGLPVHNQVYFLAIAVYLNFFAISLVEPIGNIDKGACPCWLSTYLTLVQVVGLTGTPIGVKQYICSVPVRSSCQTKNRHFPCTLIRDQTHFFLFQCTQQGVALGRTVAAQEDAVESGFPNLSQVALNGCL